MNILFYHQRLNVKYFLKFIRKMNFDKPVKVNNDYLKSSCNTFKVESEEILDNINKRIVEFISLKSVDWFGKTFKKEDVCNMFNKTEYKPGMCIVGIKFYKHKFEFDVIVEEPKAKEMSFFDYFFSLSDSSTEEVLTEEDVEEATKVSEEQEQEPEVSEEQEQEPEVSDVVDVVDVCETLEEKESEPEPEPERQPEQEPEYKWEETEYNPPEPRSYEVGEAVEVYYKGTWSKAVVVFFSDGLYDVKIGNRFGLSGLNSTQIRKIQKEATVLEQLKRDLDAAVKKKDYELAHKISQLIKNYSK